MGLSNKQNYWVSTSLVLLISKNNFDVFVVKTIVNMFYFFIIVTFILIKNPNVSIPVRTTDRVYFTPPRWCKSTRELSLCNTGIMVTLEEECVCY